MESSGPEGGKVRGPAAMIHERYLQLARDSASSGDRVLSENYMQYADHYFRLWRSTQPAAPPPQQMNDRYDEGGEGDEDNGADGEFEDMEGAAEDGDQPDVEFPQRQQQPQQQFDRDGDQRRRRGRRNRYNPEGEGGGEPAEARENGDREGGEPRESRSEPRESRGEPREGRNEPREGRNEPRENRGEPREGRGEPREERQPRERRERQPRERDENAGPEGFSSGPKPAFLRGGD